MNEESKFRSLVKIYDQDFGNFLDKINFDLIKIEGIQDIDPFSLRKKYWSKPIDEFTISPNANLGNVGDNKSFVNQIAEVNNPIEKLSCYHLYRKYANRRGFNGDKDIEDVLKGRLYIHNSTLFSLPYCVGVSTTPILTGKMQYSDLPTLPPKRPTSFTNLCIRMIQKAANLFAGATALTDFFVNYSYFTIQDRSYSDKNRENDFQLLIHGVSDEERISGQSPFTNVSILCPNTIRGMFNGYEWDGFTVEDLVEEIIKNQLIYLRLMSKGQIGLDGNRLNIPYRFPITTFVVDPSMEKEYPDAYKEILFLNKDLCFLNFMRNMDQDLKVLNMCCRLNLRLEDMLKIQINNTFGSYLTLGSHAVITINLPRIALESNGDWNEFYRILEERANEVRELLLVHRKDILNDRRLKYHDFFKTKILDLKKNFFSTIGFTGVPDAVDYMGSSILDNDGLKNILNAITLLKDLSIKFSQDDQCMYNIEEVPAESASGSLARKDKIFYPDKATKSFYSSQFVPLNIDVPLTERIRIEGILQNVTTGGSISHLNILGWLDEINGFKLQNRLIKNTNLVQYALNRGFTLCNNGHNMIGIFDECPICHSNDLDYLTRIVGYFVPVSKWSKVKKLEFKTRIWFNE